jgi:hypothetical protein
VNRFKCKKKFVPECGRTCCIEAMSVHLFCNNKLHVLALLTNIRLHMKVKLFLSALFRGSTGTGTGTPVATLILLFRAGWTLLSCLFTLGEESPGPLNSRMDRPQSHSGRFGEDEHLCSCRDSNPTPCTH